VISPAIFSPGACAAPGELQWHIQLSIVQFAARKRRQSIGGGNRTLSARVWNPAGSHCSPTTVIKTVWEVCADKERAASVGIPTRAALTISWRSDRWAARRRAEFGIGQVAEGVASQGSQARRRDGVLLPPLPPYVLLPEHDRPLSGLVDVTGISFTRQHTPSQCISRRNYSRPFRRFSDALSRCPVPRGCPAIPGLRGAVGRRAARAPRRRCGWCRSRPRDRRNETPYPDRTPHRRGASRWRRR